MLQTAGPRNDTPGTGLLHVAWNGARSVPIQAYAVSPLRLLTPRNAGTAAWIYTSTYGGGLVDGDRMSLHVHVAPGASAWVSTQSSTKVYRSPHGTTSDVRATVDAGGLLAFVPDPVTCFEGATYRQTTEIDVAMGASLVLVDTLTAGRRASGERWKFDNFDGRLTVRHNGRLIVYDGLSLRAADGDLIDRFGRFNAVAMVLVIGSPLASHAASIVTQAAALPMLPRPSLLQAASALDGGGCMLRLAGVSVEDVGNAVRSALRFLPTILGDDPWGRKW